MAEQAFSKIIEKNSDIYLMGVSQCSRLINPYYFWKSTKTTLRLTWATHNQKHYESECQIQHEYDNVVCQAPKEIVIGRLDNGIHK